LKTPGGWLRALLWYDHLKQVPEPGSLQELIAQIVMLSQKEAEIARWLVLYQALDKDKRFDHLELETMLRQQVLPYTRNMVHEARQRLKKVLDDFGGQGPMVLGPDAIVGARAMATDSSRPHPGMTPMGLIPRSED
jgi:hypothetical protein